jgi:hypothetical protein
MTRARIEKRPLNVASSIFIISKVRSAKAQR